ncbi:hypothetical protein TH53_17450 [Pedobacter lusitanus]|uniref:Contig76, whole genome shotgun sequence n=1 Tax=Pedobacter lusitanus TaxID=1503925 RepID=A0A0D0GIR7_9SPHI|nr:hypothetical protein [Pedobacter lusitanus]KIO76005.1 hypothetical protein TH53_17450 [Pedobacter lusitanus]
MRKICILLVLCFFYLSTVAQSVAVINGSPVSQKEFVWVYHKHRPENTKPALTDLISFLNIYIDFKLKVLDAREAGLDKDSTYISETRNYEKALLNSAPPEARQADFSLVTKEFNEALLLFNISEKKIWDGAENNDRMVHEYYNAHAENYSSLSYDDCKSEVVQDYQRQLECEWITALRKKYKITIDQGALSKLIR